MIDIRKTKFDYIKYTLLHKKKVLELEKEFLGKNTLRGYLHDIDKVFLYLFLDPKVVNRFHKKYARHHKRAKNKKDYIEMVIDWESARYTKPDKPLNAYETLLNYYSDKINIFLPILKNFNLDHYRNLNDPKEIKIHEEALKLLY